MGDVGHSLVVGPTGAGKSVLLALMALQFRRYRGAQVFASILVVRSARRRSPWAATGTISAAPSRGESNAPVALQPLANIDDEGERVWAAAWLTGVLSREGVVIGPLNRDLIWLAPSSLASAPKDERTLTGFVVIVQSAELKQALQPYTLDGPWGHLLDAEAESFADADVQAFETEGLIGTAAAPSVLAYLFHRIEARLSGAPTLILVDEGWLALDDPTFGAQLKEWLKTLRKKTPVSCSPPVPCRYRSQCHRTRDHRELRDHASFCPTSVRSSPRLPRSMIGLASTLRQIDILASATSKRDYYCQSRRGNRLFELRLSDVALAFCAASAKADQTAIAKLIDEHGRDAFAAEWLRHRGLDWAAELLPARNPPWRPTMGIDAWEL